MCKQGMMEAPETRITELLNIDYPASFKRGMAWVVDGDHWQYQSCGLGINGAVECAPKEVVKANIDKIKSPRTNLGVNIMLLSLL